MNNKTHMEDIHMDIEPKQVHVHSHKNKEVSSPRSFVSYDDGIENKYDQVELLVGTTINTDEIVRKSSDSKKKSDKSQQRSESLLNKIRDQSMRYRWLHDKESVYYYNLYYALQIISKIIAGLMVTLSTSSLFTDSYPVQIIAFILSIILMIILVITDQGDYKLVSTDHKNHAIEFSSIYHTIQKELAIDPNKMNDQIFISDISKDYSNTSSGAPSIRQSLEDRYDRMGIKEKIDCIGKLETSATVGMIRATTKFSDVDRKRKYDLHRWTSN